MSEISVRGNEKGFNVEGFPGMEAIGLFLRENPAIVSPEAMKPIDRFTSEFTSVVTKGGVYLASGKELFTGGMQIFDTPFQLWL